MNLTSHLRDRIGTCATLVKAYKQVPANHPPHSSARNVHRHNSAVPHRKQFHLLASWYHLSYSTAPPTKAISSSPTSRCGRRFPRDESNIICGPDGLLLLSPLPGERWISFQDLEETTQTVSAEDIVHGIEVRLGARCRFGCTDGRRFLIGDAAHLSSPFGGRGAQPGTA